ncbi:MAG TPA: hypothetical protein VFS35_10670 [Terrimicrobiaceae bacterium]|nr:hypothetical protein [Terrimicrobiaceae bacterium]
MRNLRIAGLFVLIGSLMGILAWRWISQRGLVTLNYTNAPLAQVIRSIEGQGMVEVHTNADPALLVTLRLTRAPVFEAIETLAVRIDADARLAYIAAPTGGQISEILTAFGGSMRPDGWAVFSPGYAGRLVLGETVLVDPRKVEWKVSADADQSLQALLDQGAQKTGALFAVPVDFNPTVASVPPPGRVGKVTADLLRAARGQVREVFLLNIDVRRENPPVPTESSAQHGASVFSAPGPGHENPEWAAEQAAARIAVLPPEDQAEATKRFDEARAFWETVRGLPEEERRVKIEEHMSQPEVQLRIEERAALREARQSPEQREQRYRNYIQRKEQIKGPPTKS